MATYLANERTTGKFTATITDENGTAIPAASLATVTLTLFDQASGQIINDLNGTSVLNASIGTVSAGGLLTLTFRPADMVKLTPNTIEYHEATIIWTYDSGNKRGCTDPGQIVFQIQDQQKVS